MYYANYTNQIHFIICITHRYGLVNARINEIQLKRKEHIIIEKFEKSPPYYRCKKTQARAFHLRRKTLPRATNAKGRLCEGKEIKVLTRAHSANSLEGSISAA